MPQWKPKVLSPLWGKIPDYDRGWIIALIDAEGSLGIQKNGYPMLQIWNTNLKLLKDAQSIISGALHQIKTGKSSRKPCYRLTMNKTLLSWLLPQIELIEKETQRKKILRLLYAKRRTKHKSRSTKIYYPEVKQSRSIQVLPDR
jgi:LAGLIDADG DNA endonuclease family protein